MIDNQSKRFNVMFSQPFIVKSLRHRQTRMRSRWRCEYKSHNESAKRCLEGNVQTRQREQTFDNIADNLSAEVRHSVSGNYIFTFYEALDDNFLQNDSKLENSIWTFRLPSQSTRSRNSITRWSPREAREIASLKNFLDFEKGNFLFEIFFVVFFPRKFSSHLIYFCHNI